MVDIFENKRQDYKFTAQPSSFRDPSGFVFSHNGKLFRQVNQSYQDNYSLFMRSGLYSCLVKNEMLIPHHEVDNPVADIDFVWRILEPEMINFISYPYEWCFSQFKDAALLTLDIQKIALEHGLSLKDASAYNIQFHNGRPVFIDTLSFEPYIESRPWVAYRQFCQHFLAPLAIMAKCDIRLSKLMLSYIDGLPLDLASKLLPNFSWFDYGIAMHLHLHARTQKTFSESHKPPSKTAIKFSQVSRAGLIGLLIGLRKTISKLKLKNITTEWGEYYKDTNYSDNAFEYKKSLVKKFLKNSGFKQKVWDLGANVGLFSRMASENGLFTVAFDIDPIAVENNYCQVRENKDGLLLPLLLDLTNPSPGIGWNGVERKPLVDRGPADWVMALALIHHLSISNNVPFNLVASFFAKICRYKLIIEFVPKSDRQVQRLLRSRDDVFVNYNRDYFEKAFKQYFTIERAELIEGTERVLYPMQRNNIC